MKRYNCLSRSKKITDTINQNRADDRRTDQGEEYSKKRRRYLLQRKKEESTMRFGPYLNQLKNTVD